VGVGGSKRAGAYDGAHARWRAAAIAVGLIVASPGADASRAGGRQCLDEAEICIEAVSDRSMVRFVASNRTTAPYTLRIAPRSLSNLRPLSAMPFRAVLEPGEERVVGALSAIAPDRSTGYRYGWSAAPGSMLARHDDRWRYRMPFGGRDHRPLSQGVGGASSHGGPGHYAFDFAMPWGTPVLAARAGRVIAVRDGQRSTGSARSAYHAANAVEILHVDGTIATYAHLQRGAKVEAGQSVETGDLLGLSGDTGISTGPHLHFMVWRRTADLQWRTVAIRFHDGSHAGFVPNTGVAYAPGCSIQGIGCSPEEGTPPSEAWPVAPARRSNIDAPRRLNGACVCPNGARIHVDLPCEQVCGR
jgi:murein DD-endopeptidase MepM/ murein hydrolase activator NlpD